MKISPQYIFINSHTQYITWDLWHLLMLMAFEDKGKCMRQPWCRQRVSLPGSCSPRWICCSLQTPHLYWADTMLCIRQRQTPWSTTSCTQHMSHASCTRHFSMHAGSTVHTSLLVSHFYPPQGECWDFVCFCSSICLAEWRLAGQHCWLCTGRSYMFSPH